MNNTQNNSILPTTGNIDPAISAGQIGSQTAIQVPPVLPQQNLIAGLPQQLQATADASTQQQTTEQNALVSLQNQLTGQTADMQAQQEALGYTQNMKELKDLTNLSNKQQADYLAGYVQAEGARNTRQETNVVQQNLTRQHGIDALLTNSLISAKQGDISFANTLVDRAIAAKYDPIKAKIEVQKTILDQINTKASEDRKNALNMQLKQYDKQIEDEKNSNNMLTDAIAQGAPMSVINSAQKIIANGGTPTDVAVAVGQYSGAYAKAQLLKEQIKTEKAQQSNYYASAAKTRAETGTDGGKPATPAQVEYNGYAIRTKQANDIIDAKADVLKKLTYADFKLIESNSQLANSLLSDDKRQAAQAMRNFITAKLRKESGASISPSEFSDARLQYFPALNDDDQTLANKKALRDSVLQVNIQGAGNAYKKDPNELYLDTVTTSITKTDGSTVSSSSYADSVIKQ